MPKAVRGSWAVVVQYGIGRIHFASIHESEEIAVEFAGKAADRLRKKYASWKRLKPTVTVWECKDAWPT